MFILTIMRKLRLYVVTILALVAGANTLMAQELKYGVDFVTLFDNTEYAGMQQQWSLVYCGKSTCGYGHTS